MRGIRISLAILFVLIPTIVSAEVTSVSVGDSDGTQTRIFYTKGKEVAKQIKNIDGTIKVTGKIPDGIVKEHTESGELRFERNFKNGKLEGVSKQFFSDGKLLEEVNYKGGKREGINKQYYKSGKLLSERTFRNGKLEGITKMYYDESGELTAELHYKDGNLDGANKVFYKNGKLRSMEIYKNGQKISSKSYDSDGKLLFENNYPVEKKVSSTTTTQLQKSNKPEKVKKK